MANASGEVETLRLSVVRSIDETRQELKAAYANVTSLRRRLSELEEHNRTRRTRIAEGLTRAESLLSTIRAAAR